MTRSFISEKLSLRRFIQYVIAFLCLALIFVYFDSHREELVQLTRIGPVHVLKLAVLFLMINVVSGYKNFLILKNLQLKNISFAEWFKIFIISRFLGHHLIQGTSFYRILKLKKEYDFPYTKAIGMTLYFLWMEMLAVLLLGGGSIFFLWIGPNTQRSQMVCVLVPLFLGTLVMPFLMQAVLRRINAQTGFFTWLKDKFDDLATTIVNQARQLNMTGQYFFLTVVGYMFCFFVIWIVFRLIGTDLTFSQQMVFSAVLIFTKIANITPGNIGVGELICGYFSEYLGASIGTGIIVSGIFRAMDYSVLAVLSLVFRKSI